MRSFPLGGHPSPAASIHTWHRKTGWHQHHRQNHISWIHKQDAWRQPPYNTDWLIDSTRLRSRSFWLEICYFHILAAPVPDKVSRSPQGWRIVPVASKFYAICPGSWKVFRCFDNKRMMFTTEIRKIFPWQPTSANSLLRMNHFLKIFGNSLSRTVWDEKKLQRFDLGGSCYSNMGILLDSWWLKLVTPPGAWFVLCRYLVGSFRGDCRGEC